MAIANLQGMVIFCEAEKGNLTYRLSEIMGDITKATTTLTQVMKDGLASKAAVNAHASESSYYADSNQYSVDLAAAEDQYELKMAEVNAWEAELEQEKDRVSTQLQEVTSYQESFTAALKSNVKKDFSYGGASGSS